MLKYIYLGNDVPPLPAYNLFLGIGMIAFFLSLEKVIGKNAIPLQTGERIKNIALACAGSGVLGAALAEAVYHRTVTGIAFSGFTFYGGLIASLCTLWAVARIKGVDSVFAANVLALPLVLGHAFGRIGCFLGGCCYGVPTSSVFGVVFPEGSLPYDQFGARALHPVQLYESFFLFVFSIVLAKTELRWRATAYLITYPVIRFIIECFRGDNRGALLLTGFSPSQEISMLLFVAGIGLFYYLKSRLILHLK